MIVGACTLYNVLVYREWFITKTSSLPLHDALEEVRHLLDERGLPLGRLVLAALPSGHHPQGLGAGALLHHRRGRPVGGGG